MAAAAGKGDRGCRAVGSVVGIAVQEEEEAVEDYLFGGMVVLEVVCSYETFCAAEYNCDLVGDSVIVKA